MGDIMQRGRYTVLDLEINNHLGVAGITATIVVDGDTVEGTVHSRRLDATVTCKLEVTDTYLPQIVEVDAITREQLRRRRAGNALANVVDEAKAFVLTEVKMMMLKEVS